MKKKIEILQKGGHLENKPDFIALNNAFLSAKSTYHKHAEAEEEAKKSMTEGKYQHADIEQFFHLKTEYKKAKYLAKHHKAILDFARFKLKKWINNFLQTAEFSEFTEEFIKLVKAARKKQPKIKEEKTEAGPTEKAKKLHDPKAEKKQKTEKEPKVKTENKTDKTKKADKTKTQIVADQQPKPKTTVTKIIKTVTTSTTPSPTVAVKKDDLKKIEGIGPKIEQLLNEAKILTFSQLADAKPDAIREILTSAGPRYKLSNPDTWPAQARLAAGEVK